MTNYSTLSPEQRKVFCAKNTARRSAKRAAKALAEGRTPGKPGTRKFSFEELKASMKATYTKYRQKNLDKIRKRDAEIKRKERSTPEGKQNHRDRQKAYAKRNKEKVITGYKAWIEANKEKRRSITAEYTRQYRARKMKADGNHTFEDIKELWFLQKGNCAWCSESLGDDMPHVDHWMPLSKGGSNDKSNLRLLHAKCNKSKGAKIPDELKLGIVS